MYIAPYSHHNREREGEDRRRKGSQRRKGKLNKRKSKSGLRQRRKKYKIFPGKEPIPRGRIYIHETALRLKASVRLSTNPMMKRTRD